MKTWSVLYGLIWASFFQIFLIVFLLSVVGSSPLWTSITTYLHVAIGVIVIALAGYAARLVRGTSCPERIKRITRTTSILAGFQVVLGLILFTLIHFNVSVIAQDVILFLHVATALAIITQASSSATAYDMWEEKEFLAPPLTESTT